MLNAPSIDCPWRVCVTRDEPADGPLSAAPRTYRLQPVRCPVLVESPPENRQGLDDAARHLGGYDWVVCGSARSVRALTRARGDVWPPGVRMAAVGGSTAGAFTQAGAAPPPVTAAGDGAEALWSSLEHAAIWTQQRVVVPTTPGGRRVLIDRLREAGAIVDDVEAYRMTPRAPDAIARDWAAAPDAVVIGSARVADVLVDVLGAGTLNALRRVVALGQTTAAALGRLGIPCQIPSRADFTEVARLLAARRTAALGS
ncbi:MAG: uroporphyrinogen-III synthase [Acidobacteriota bacterium]